MRILISIATYGTKNIEYLNKVIDEYISYKNYEVHIIVHGTHPLERSDIEFIKYENPKNTVFLHRSEFYKNRYDYDYYLFTEDDMLIKEDTIKMCLEYEDKIPINSCIGFLRFENTPENIKYLIDLWLNIDGYNYIKNKNIEINNTIYFSVTNPHQACYFISKNKLNYIIENTDYNIDGEQLGLESASSGIFTDWYLGTGVINKIIPVLEIDKCLIEHLPGNHCNPPGVNSTPEIFKQNTVTINKLYKDINS